MQNRRRLMHNLDLTLAYQRPASGLRDPDAR